MSQVQIILTTVKRLLKANGITYKVVAESLNLSEASVKRLFSEKDFSLERLEQIAVLLGMDIIELMQHVSNDRRFLSKISIEQEQELVADKRLLLVAHLAINGWGFEDILNSYTFKEPELISCLIKLQKIGFLELLPLNRIKLTVSPQFSWRTGGPVQQFFLKNFLTEFFNPPFESDTELLFALSGMITPESQRILNQKIREIELLFIECTRRDAKLPVAQRINYGCVIALRPWLSKLYDALRK